jgi:hypothetical protein
VKALSAGRYYYGQADAILDDIAKEVPHGTEIVFNDAGDKATLLDQFAEGNKAFKPSFIGRYQLKVKEAARR